jgi:hypothetical protein
MEKEPALLFEQDITVYAEWHFFYIQDKEAFQESLEHSWTDQAIKMMLAMNTHTVGIATARSDEYIVHLSVLNVAPTDDFTEWDYVIETSIYVPSGQIRVAGPVEYLPETTCMHLPNNGYYKIRAYYGKLRSVSEDELEGDDHYQLILWPSEDRTLNVLKSLTT